MTWREKVIAPPAPRVKTPGDLLAEVLASPDDDAPRLVYADLLSQAGDPRGEFIVVQCELARLGEATGAEVDALRAREGELLARHRKTWVGEFAGTRTEYGPTGGKTYAKGTPTKWTFVRGFVDRVDMQVDDLIRNAPALFAREPVRCVHPTGGSIAALLAKCDLSRLRVLDLSPFRFDDKNLRALAADRTMTSLVELSMSRCKLGAQAIEGFAAAAVEKPSLRYLDLSWNTYGDRGAIALARSSILAHLDTLYVSVSKVAARGAAALEASPYRAGIKVLST